MNDKIRRILISIFIKYLKINSIFEDFVLSFDRHTKENNSLKYRSFNEYFQYYRPSIWIMYAFSWTTANSQLDKTISWGDYHRKWASFVDEVNMIDFNVGLNVKNLYLIKFNCKELLNESRNNHFS